MYSRRASSKLSAEEREREREKEREREREREKERERERRKERTEERENEGEREKTEERGDAGERERKQRREGTRERERERETEREYYYLSFILFSQFYGLIINNIHVVSSDAIKILFTNKLCTRHRFQVLTRIFFSVYKKKKKKSTFKSLFFKNCTDLQSFLAFV